MPAWPGSPRHCGCGGRKPPTYPPHGPTCSSSTSAYGLTLYPHLPRQLGEGHSLPWMQWRRQPRLSCCPPRRGPANATKTGRVSLPGPRSPPSLDYDFPGGFAAGYKAHKRQLKVFTALHEPTDDHRSVPSIDGSITRDFSKYENSQIQNLQILRITCVLLNWFPIDE